MKNLWFNIRYWEGFEVIGLILLIIFIILIVLSLCVVTYSPVLRQTCINQAHILQVDYKYDFFAGCYINYEGDWIKYPDQYNIIKLLEEK